MTLPGLPQMGVWPKKGILSYLPRATQTPQAPTRPEINDNWTLIHKRLAPNGLDVPQYSGNPYLAQYDRINPLHLARDGALYRHSYPSSWDVVSLSQKELIDRRYAWSVCVCVRVYIWLCVRVFTARPITESRNIITGYTYYSHVDSAHPRRLRCLRRKPAVQNISNKHS